MSSFTAPGATVTFVAVAGDYEETREARVAIQEIPGGDEFTIDQGGRVPLRWRVVMLLENESVWGALNAVLGQLGTVNIDGLTGHEAVLLSASRRAPYPDGQTIANAEFIITDT
jgi:hypothetical protein